MKRWKPKLSNTGVFELEAELTVLILEGEGAEPRMLLLFLYYFYIIFILFLYYFYFLPRMTGIRRERYLVNPCRMTQKSMRESGPCP